MSLPIYSSIGTTTASSTACAITTGKASGGIDQQQPMITATSYMIDSAGGTTLTVAFEELGTDGTWRALSAANGSLGNNAAPPTLTAAAKVSGTIIGQFHGIRLNFTIATATINYAELKGVVLSNA